MKKILMVAAGVCGLFGLGYVAGVSAAPKPHIYELRTYTTPDGKLEDLKARFKNHTLRIFEKHGMKNVIYTVPTDAPASQNTLIYLLQHDSKEAAIKNWDAFRNDPEWVKARAESEKNGKIVDKAVGVYLEPVDFSPMK
ncbi:NIPSNAP family protein [Bryobacter aggregatus]|uniref:NIPSNAP family protein n=1 Tax=Bryobacter aggregatus TaxID=360054 RepID=UPI001EE226D6|nr:NIPSNAP family protein [Bryobacter aggregatus]